MVRTIPTAALFNERVEGTVGFQSGFDQVLHALFVAHVRRHRHRGAAGLADALTDVLQRLRPTCGQNHPRPGGCKCFGRSRPDPAGSAGDNDDPVAQRVHGCLVTGKAGGSSSKLAARRSSLLLAKIA